MRKFKDKIKTIAKLTFSAAVVIHIINRVIVASASLMEMLDHFSGKKYYHWRGTKIYYTKQGQGSPVLLIHDALPGASGYEWQRIEGDLSEKHTVYTIDLLGYGRSDKPGLTYTNFLYVQLIRDFIKNIIKEKADIITSGYSASFAIMSCQYDREWFGKFMLINPPSPDVLRQAPGWKENTLKTILQIPIFGTLIYHMIVSRETIKDNFIEKLYYNPFRIDEDMVDAYYEASHKGGCYAKYSYICYSSKYMNINILAALKAFENEICILEGKEEIAGTSIVEEYRSANPEIDSIVIQKSKHFPHVENSKCVLEQAEIFFDK